MNRRLRCGVVAGLSLWLAVLAQGQQPSDATNRTAASADLPRLIPRSHSERERSYSAEHRIILNAQVTDASGKPASGLSGADFLLFDDRQPRKLASFRASGGSSAVERAHGFIVLDAVNNSGRTLAVERREIEKFLRLNRGLLEVPLSLAVLSQSGIHAGRATRDADMLAGELKQIGASLHPMDCGDRGGPSARQASSETFAPALDMSPQEAIKDRETRAECLNRRFTISVSALNRLAREQEDVPGRAIVIWLGEGWPLLLGPEFAAESKAESRNYFDYLADLSASLREGQITLDSVSSPDLFRKAEAGAEKLSSVPPPGADEAHTGDFALARLVNQTGGRVLDDANDLAGEIEKSIDDARSYYVLAFDAAPAAGVGEYRTLEVKVNKPGLTVRTNTAYFARP